MKFFSKTLVAAIVIAAMTTSGSAFADVIANWTFETSVPIAAGPHAAEVGAGSALGLHASGATVYSNPSGNGSLESFSSNNWAIGDYYQFTVSTLTFEDITLSFDQASSSTGPGEFQLEYRVGGAGAFTVHAPYVVLPNQVAAPGLGTWGATFIAGYNNFFDLSAITALDNQATVEFRLAMRTANDAVPPGTVAAAGTSRVDNVLVQGVMPIPEPTTAGLGLLGMASMLFVRRKRAC